MWSQGAWRARHTSCAASISFVAAATGKCWPSTTEAPDKHATVASTARFALVLFDISNWRTWNEPWSPGSLGQRQSGIAAPSAIIAQKPSQASKPMSTKKYFDFCCTIQSMAATTAANANKPLRAGPAMLRVQPSKSTRLLDRKHICAVSIEWNAHFAAKAIVNRAKLVWKYSACAPVMITAIVSANHIHALRLWSSRFIDNFVRASVVRCLGCGSSPAVAR